MSVELTQFESDFGFKSPGFTVDDQGNVVVKSLSYLDPDANIGLTEDFIISNAGTEFVLSDSAGTPIEGQNPTINLLRGETYVFKLELSLSLAFSILNESANATYDINVTHTSLDGVVSEGVDAQGKRSGFLTFVVPINSPDQLGYGDLTVGTTGIFEIGFPVISGIGQFSELIVSGNSSLGNTQIVSTEESLGLTSGALVVAGGAAIAKDLNVGGDLIAEQIKTNGTGFATFETQTNLIFDVGNRIDVKVGNTLIGQITADGSALKVVNTTIDNTVIGSITPAKATFSEGVVSKIATQPTEIANKTYVDLNSAAFAIALGT